MHAGGPLTDPRELFMRLARAREEYYQARRKQLDWMETGSASIGTPDGRLALTHARRETDAVQNALKDYECALDDLSDFLAERLHSADPQADREDPNAGESELGSPLTPREIEVLKLVASGLTTKQVALSLGISFKTAACHRARLMDKLNIHETASLVRYAFERRYISPGTPPSATEMEKLHSRIRSAAEEYRSASQEYDACLRAQKVHDPRLRMLRQAEREKHESYLAALRAMRAILQDGNLKASPPRKS